MENDEWQLGKIRTHAATEEGWMPLPARASFDFCMVPHEGAADAPMATSVAARANFFLYVYATARSEM